MYRDLLERAAERDLRRLPARLHDRVIAAIRELSFEPRPSGCRKLTGADRDWAFVSAIIELFLKSMTPWKKSA